MGAEYTFWVRGRISPDLIPALHPLHPVADGRRTELRAVVGNQAELHAIIDRLEDLAIGLVAFRRS